MRTALIAALLLVGGGTALEATCGPPAVCGDTTSSIFVQDLEENVRVTWSTDDEQGVSSYIIRRYDCGTPATCSIYVTSVSPAGTCGTNHDDLYETTNPSGGPWTWTVEVWKADNTRACAIDAVPQ